MTEGRRALKIEEKMGASRKEISSPPEGRAYYSSPIGTIEIIGNEDGLLATNFVSQRPPAEASAHRILREALQQIDEYFRGKRTSFSLELVFRGTEFQTAVWRRVIEIPYGETRSYREIAEAVGKPKAVRAVGTANAGNKIGIVIPCHRVIGSDGELIGYGGGLWRKEWLLAHERQHAKGVR